MIRQFTGKRASLILPLLLMAYSLMFPVRIFALPQGGTVVAGQAQIATPDVHNMHINQATQKAIINWQKFGIGQAEAVRFFQPGASSIALNRVVGIDPSIINGLLSANGRIFVINPNGLLIGPTGQINVHSFLASTLDINNQDFLSDRFVFSRSLGQSLSAVINQGRITAADGGSVSLLAPAVRNEGTIMANFGKVFLGAGEQMTLSFAGSDLIKFAIDESVKDKVMGTDGQTMTDAVSNTGTITADGGEVALRGKVAAGLVQSVVNNSGIIEAKSLVEREGVIRLEGVGEKDDDMVINSGSLDVSGKEEGATGGMVYVLGSRVGLFGQSKIDASGDKGGGKVLIGGDFQGKNPEIQNAERTYVGPEISIKADAISEGDGGRVIVWADEVTRYYGDISARGGALGGDGGFVEVSGKKYLHFGGRVNTSALNGNMGTLLLDPDDITIVTGSAFSPGPGSASIAATTANIGGTGDTIWAASEDPSSQTIGETDVYDLLLLNHTVLQATGTITASTGVNITWANANSLTLDAGTDITLNDATFSSGTAALNLMFGQGGISGVLDLGSSDLTGMGTVSLTANDGVTNPDSYTISRAGGNTWNIMGANQGNIAGIGAVSGALNFANVGNLIGGTTGADTFTLTTGSISGLIDGAAGADTLIGNNLVTAWAITGANAGTLTDANGVNAFTGIESLVGGTLADTFTLGSGVATFNGSIAGGGGADTLAATDGANSWAVTGADAGTLNTSTTFSAIVNLTGGSGSDTFNLDADVGSLSGSIDGGAGADTLSYAGTSTTVNVTLASSGSNGFTSAAGPTGIAGTFANINTLTGGDGAADALTGRNANSTWTLSGAPAYFDGAQTLNFSAFEIFSGGSGNDTFNASVLPASATISGGGGTDAFNVSGPINMAGNLAVTAEALNNLGGNTITANQITIDGATAIGALGLPIQTNVNVLTITASNADTFISESSGIDLATLNIGSGDLNLTAVGPITQSGALSIGGTTTIANAGHDIDFDNVTNDFVGTVSVAGNNVTLVDASAVVLGSHTIAGNLSWTTGGAVTQSAPLNVAGTTTIVSAGSNITLNNAANDFSGAVAVTGANVQIADANVLDIGASTTSGSFAASAGGGVIVSGAVNSAGSFASFGTDFDNTGGAISTINNDIIIDHTGTVTIGAAMNSGDDLLGAGGDINIVGGSGVIVNAAIDSGSPGSGGILTVAGGVSLNVSPVVGDRNISIDGNGSNISIPNEFILTADTILNAGLGGDVIFGTAVTTDGADTWTLAINAAGNTTFGGAVGSATNPLGELVTDAAGTLTFNGTSIHTTTVKGDSGDVIFGEAAEIGNNLSITTNGGNVLFGGTLGLGGALSVDSGLGNTTFTGLVTAGASNLSVTDSAVTTITGGISGTTGAIDINALTRTDVDGAITLSGAGTVSIERAQISGVNVSTAGGNITFTGAATLGTINAGNSSITLAGTTINGGILTGSSAEISGETIGLSSQPILDVNNLNSLTLSAQDATGTSGLLQKTGALNQPPAENIQSVGTVIIAGFPIYAAGTFKQALQAVQTESATVVTQKIIEELLKDASKADFFMSPPLMVNIDVEDIGLLEEVEEDCESDPQTGKCIPTGTGPQSNMNLPDLNNHSYRPTLLFDESWRDVMPGLTLSEFIWADSIRLQG